MKQPNDRGGRPFPYIQTKTRWRERPTDELKYLRAQVIELEKLIARLSHSDTRTLTNNEMPLADNEAKELRKLQDESQARRMDFAFAENRKLRAMIVSQLHLARSLQTAIDEHTQLRARKLTWPTNAAASDGLIFTLLDQEKEYQYAALDKVLEESGVAQTNHSLYSSLLLHRNPSGVSFQHNEVRMLPFAVSEVARSMRFSMSHGARVGPTEHCRKIQMFDNYFHAVTVDTIEVPEAPPAEVHSRVLQLCVT